MSARVRLGYKQTEVGLIPEDWHVVSLGSLTTLMTNGFVGTATRHYTENENGVLYIQGYNVEENSFNFHGVKYVTEDFHKFHAKSCLRSGDLLTVQTGDVGLTTVISDELAGSNCHALIITRFDKKRTNPTFVSNYLNSFSGRSRLRLIETGTTMKHLNVGDMLTFLIPTPPTKAEQEAIAEALTDTDALIESLEQLVAKKRQIKQGAMQELLTPQASWVDKKLGDTAILKARIGWQGLTTNEYLDTGDYYLVTGTDFKDGGIDWNHCPYVEESRYKQDKYIQLRQHDVLVTKDGTIGKVALVKQIDKPATLNSGVFVIRPTENAFFPAFFYYLLCSPVFSNFLAQLSAGSTINHLYQKDFVTFIYSAPSTIEEQAAIAAILSEMDAEITELDAQLMKARYLKQGMMDKLLTGEIRLI